MSKLVPVQVLRALAALSVAMLHGQYEVGLLAARQGGAFAAVRPLPWEAGVDVFFAISGFVMVYASRSLFGRPGARPAFLVRRLARIVPLYWLTTTLYLALALAAPRLLTLPSAGPGYILASYLFIPVARPDGAVQPLYSLGWTLDYEMFFYVLFALWIVLSRRVAVAAVAATLLAVVALGRLWPSPPDAIAFWADPIVLEFGFGMVLGLARADGLCLGMTARVGLGLAGLAGFALAAHPGLAGLDPPRILLFGVPAALLVAACGLGHEHRAAEETRPTRAAVAIGDASYAIYLIHPFVIRGVMHLAGALSPAADPGIVLAAALAATVVVAWAVHRLVERPATALLRRMLGPAGRPQERLQPRIGDAR